MTCRCCLLLVLGWWLCPTVSAQQPSPKVIVWGQRSATSEAYFGIVGEIAKPGVYTSTAPQVTLQELVQRAGGVTRRGSPAARIIRNGRSGQGVFYTPNGHDLLAPNDLVVIDPVRNPHQPLVAAEPLPTDGNVWIGLVGVSDHPEVVWVNPEQANLPNIMVMLGQSAPLARSVQTILPPRLPQPRDPFELLPNGAVLVFDRTLLVAGTLPKFPHAMPLVEPASPPVAAADSTTNADLPPLPMAPGVPVNDAPSTAARAMVDATAVPFVAERPDQVPANPASLAAPGSRFAAPPPPVEPSQLKADPVPQKPSQRPLFVEPEPSSVPEIVGETAVESSPPTTGLGWWQMLGIGGTVASLVGVALISRRYIGRQTSSGDEPVGKNRIARQLAEVTRRRNATDAVVEHPPRQGGVRSCPAASEDKLEDLLSGRLPVVSEAVEIPRGLRIKGSPRHVPDQKAYRLDRTESTPPPPHREPKRSREPILKADTAAEAPAIPAPHFGRSHRPPTPGEGTTAPKTPTGTALERALSQLREGLKS